MPFYTTVVLMLINATPESEKTKFLAEKYCELVKRGVTSEEILVLCQSPHKRKIFQNFVNDFLETEAISKPCIYTFYALCNNFILDFWPILENSLKDNNAILEPNLCGLEVSGFIFKKSIDEVEFKGYNSKVNLLHQLFKRYTLICQNALKEDEIKEKTKILKESFSNEACKAIKLYRAKTLQLRSFDYLRQVEAFSFLYKNVKNPFRYVFVDDADEITPACFEYLKYIKPDIKEFFVAFDKNGSSREGYLSAIKIDFKEFLNEKIQNFGKENQNADLILQGILNKTPSNIPDIEFASFVRRDEMIFSAIKKINCFLKNGVKPSEIAVITPLADEYLKYYLRKINCATVNLSGSEKIAQNSFVHTIISILKMVNFENFALENYILFSFLSNILGLDFENSFKVAKIIKEKRMFPDLKNENYLKFLDFFQNKKHLKLSEQFAFIAVNFIPLTEKNQEKIKKINELLKQTRDFENVLGIDLAKNYLLNNLENTIISENPLSYGEDKKEAVILATPQKIIDAEIKTKYQFWLDTTSASWIKQDIGPLYNAWVFQKNWNKKDFTLEDNIRLTEDKTARILRKLYLCHSQKIFAYSSMYDFNLNENFSGINGFFVPDNKQEKKKQNNIIPRKDQKPVLDYKKGKMGVLAVAGSGKTTIMLAVIMKLLSEGVNARNIFVLTFMDSAAQNFKERIKSSFPNLRELPSISTIHGLAHRILRENNNYALLSLDEDFEIIDETAKSAILGEIMHEAGLLGDKSKIYERAVSMFKGQENQKIKSPMFKKIFEKYQNYLQENNLLDYDDILLNALKLLKTNEDVRCHYQKLAKYVIEDEAQDSSAVQQELIKILGTKNGNIIRCGDINQAITSTFSNSDVKGFRKFLEDNLKVEMDYSQRCSKGVLNVANSLIDFAEYKGSDAFLNVKMKPVEGVNPIVSKSVVHKIFKNQNEEREFILKEIQEIFKKEQNATVGILLRSNWSVGDFETFLKAYNIKTKIKTDSLSSSPVFAVILGVLKIISEPSNENILSFSETLNNLNLSVEYSELKKYMENLELPFIETVSDNFQLWFDLRYFFSNTEKSIKEQILDIGYFYFKDDENIANIPLIAEFIEKIKNQNKELYLTVKKLYELSKKANFTRAKFFKPQKKSKGVVEIMTLHKSKGDEFDYVFVPELTDENMTLDENDVKLKEDTLLAENLKMNPKSPIQLKKEIAQENYRLLYVAITRAKKRLYLSCAKSYKCFGKLTNKKPCIIFEELFKEAL